jgi:NitT/TauT family transport system permease protein
MGLLDFDNRLTKRQYASLGAGTFVVTIALWQSASAFGWVQSYFLPSPTAVLQAGWGLFRDFDLWKDLRASFYRVTLGYLLAVILGLPVGILVGAFHVFEAVIEPMNDFVRYTPLPAFVPLVILWAGIGELSQVLLIFLGVFWSLIVLVADVVSNVPRNLRETAATLGTGRLKILFHVVVPCAMPGIFDAMRVSIGWAWSSLILAEIVGANTGLGHMIMESQRFLRTPNVIAGIVIVGAIGLGLDALFKIAYAALFPWSPRKG